MAIQKVSDLSVLINPVYKSEQLNNTLIEISYPVDFNTEYTKYQSMSIRYKDIADTILSGVISEESVVFVGNKYFRDTTYFMSGIELSGNLLVNNNIPDDILKQYDEKNYHSYIKELNNTIVALKDIDDPSNTGINLLCAENSNKLYAPINEFQSNNNEFRDSEGNLIFGIYNDRVDAFVDQNIFCGNVNVDSDHIKYQSNNVEWYNKSNVRMAYFDGNNFHFKSDIYGCAMSARWADLAELYETDDIYKAGTLVKFGGEKEITIATDEVNAVITTKPAFTMNSDCNGPSQGIALTGRTPVRVIGKLNKFDNIKLSDIPGVAVKSNDNSDKIVGKSLQSKTTEEEGLVECVVKLTF